MIERAAIGRGRNLGTIWKSCHRISICRQWCLTVLCGQCRFHLRTFAAAEPRTIPAAIKRALLLRDRTCRFPGCTHRQFVDGHHVKHWGNGGATALHNLVLLCGTHHRLVHEGGLRVQADNAASAGGTRAWQFVDPRGHVVEHNPSARPVAWPGCATTMPCSRSPRGPTPRSGPEPISSTPGALSI